MAETEQQQQPQPEQPEEQVKVKAPPKQKEVIATKVTGTVKWFNVKSGYGFINRNDTKEDVFVHQTAIAKNNPKKRVRSVGDGETVEFNVVVGEKGNEAADVTGPNGEAVRGSPFAAEKKHYRSWYFTGGRGGRPPQRRPRENHPSEGEKDGAQLGGEDGPPGPPRRYRPRRGRGGYRGGGGYMRGGYMGPPRDGYQGNPDEIGDAPMRGPRGPPRRFYARNIRGNRGGGPRPTSQDSQGQGDQRGQGGSRPRYRRRGPPRPHNSQSDEGNGAPKSEDSAAVVVKTEESQPVQNTTTESTA